ncbi:MAG TPA: hypothetical protein VFE61_12330 [Candidatus Sulfotelmatobacter sp.]|nr:hypothetical protein [Candidatus Sulfotelmatobacter sp.]
MKPRTIFLSCFLGIISAGSIVNAAPQINAYQQTNLVSNHSGTGTHVDPNLINPWGI